MPDVTMQIDGVSVQLPQGTVVAAALLNHALACRTSVQGEPRAALCGMGVCMECRATVDGVRQRRTCQVVCREGMTVETRS